MCPPHLDAPERLAWDALRAVLADFTRTLTVPLQRTVGLSYFEYEILQTLAGSPRSTCRLGDLAVDCHSSLSTLSRAVTRLESRGVVTRRLDPANGRYVVCELTESGSQVLRTGVTEHVDQLRRLVFDALTETQVHQLTDICTVLGEALAAEAQRDDS